MIFRKMGFGIILFFVWLNVGCQANVPIEVTQTAVSVTATPSPTPEASVLLDGLLNPVGIEPLPDGSLLIAEEGSGADDLSAGITLRLPDGQHGRILDNVPSSRDAGDLSGIPFVKWQEGIMYSSHFNLGHLATLPLELTEPLTLPETPYTLEDLTPVMTPLNAIQLRNPFDMTFDEEGNPIVSDATENGVASLTDDGRTRFFHRFDLLENNTGGKPLVEPVPTGILRSGNEFLVTLTTGCPYPATLGELVAIDAGRNQRTVVGGLSMPIDVAEDSEGTLWLLEFARFREGGDCFSGQDYLPFTGQLSKISASNQQTVVLTDLNFPGAIAFDRNGRLLITEIFSGRVLQISGVQQIKEPTSITTLLGEPLPQEPAAAEPKFPLQLVNRATEVGLDFQHQAFTLAVSKDPVAMMGAGLCWLDFDQDGWLDLYLVNSHALDERPYWDTKDSLPHNRLYRNQNGTFEDISQASKTDLALRGNGCVAADFNQDGWTDIYVTADGPNALLWNQGDGTFEEGAERAGIAATEWNASAAVGDLNQDGWLDLFVTSYINLENMIENPVGAFPQDFYGLADHFYLNNGDGTFTEVTEQIGLLKEERSLGAVLSDFDTDGDLDLYIANDGHPNRLYRTHQDDTDIGFYFEDVSQASGTNDSGSGMGIAAGDYDNNGRFDILVTNWDTELNALYLNQLEETNDLTFRYSTFRIGLSGLGNNITGWGTAWGDFDNDTDEDLIVVNGHVPITDLEADAQLVRLYGNLLAEDKPGQFRDWTTLVGLSQTDLGPLMARGSAVADYDNDGDLDIAINQISGPVILLENQSQPQNWLGVIIPQVEPGTLLTLTLPDGTILTREARIGSSYLASEDPRFHFGLGANPSPLLLTVTPPLGQPLQIEITTLNQYLKIE